MATKNNAKVRSFRHGGTIAIGADTFINIPAGGGGLRFNYGVKERLVEASMDQGAIGSVPEGDETRGFVEFSLRYTGDAGSTGSFVDIFTADSADGYVVAEDIVVTVFAFAGDTNGESFTFSNAFLADPEGIVQEVGSGGEVDIQRARFLHDSRMPAIATVGP